MEQRFKQSLIDTLTGKVCTNSTCINCQQLTARRVSLKKISKRGDTVSQILQRMKYLGVHDANLLLRGGLYES